MNTEQQNVKQFMLAFGQECPEKPTIPSLEVRKLRAKLILEEALETIAALGVGVYFENDETYMWKDALQIREWPEGYAEVGSNDMFQEPNLVEIADGLADLSYVLYGTALSCGLNMEPIEKEVHRSNMSKMWTNNELGDMPMGCKYTTTGNPNQVVVWDLSGKVIKSPSYSSASLLPIIEEQSK